MSKSYRLETVPYEALKEKYFHVPDKCIQLVIANNGLSNIVVDNLNEVKPGEAFVFPNIPGYYIKQNLRIQVINDSSKGLGTKVRIRLAIEN